MWNYWLLVILGVFMQHAAILCSLSFREDVPSSRPKPNCWVHLHVLQGEAHRLAAGPHSLGQSLQSWERCSTFCFMFTEQISNKKNGECESHHSVPSFLKRNTASGRSPAYAYGSDPPSFNMWDSILLLLERSKSSQWVSRPHSCLFSATVEATSWVDIFVSHLSASCRTRTSWSRCSTRCTSTPRLRSPLQWRYRALIAQKKILCLDPLCSL